MASTPDTAASGGERPSSGEWALALAFAVAALTVLMPWPRPSLPLRAACDFAPAGRFAVECDLSRAAGSSGRAWLRKAIRVYENGILLREADKAGDARRLHPGSYHTTGAMLTLSALDRSDPRTNGRDYVARPRTFDPLGFSRGSRRLLAASLLAATLAAACLARRRRLMPSLWAGATALAAAGVVVQVVAVLEQAPVHVDAGYALSSAEALVSGKRLYSSLLFNYTPLGLYQFAAWGRLWPVGAPPYSWYLAFVLLAEAGCAALAFLLMRRSGVSAPLAGLTAMSYLSMMLWFDGSRVLFEPLYLWPILASAVLALSPGAVSGAAAGGLAAVAFLTKQYGGFGLAGLSAFSLVSGPGRLRRAAAIGLGFGLALLVLLILLHALGCDLQGMLRQAIGASYPRRFETVWLELALRTCPIALLALVVPFLPGAWSRPPVRAMACLGIASCLPFYFRQHQYYLMNVWPWLFGLFALGVEHVASREVRWRRLVPALAAVLLVSIPLRAAAAQAALVPAEARSDQLRRGLLMNAAWPAGRPTLLLMHPGFYHVTRYRSGDEAALGYRFLNECSAGQLRAGFSRAAGAWVDPRGMYARGADRVLREAGSSLEQELRANGFERRVVVEDRLELWTKGEAP